jgi:hypothetical protein
MWYFHIALLTCCVVRPSHRLAVGVACFVGGSGGWVKKATSSEKPTHSRKQEIGKYLYLLYTSGTSVWCRKLLIFFNSNYTEFTDETRRAGR